jgi:ABC-2 type transport system permease protein
MSTTTIEAPAGTRPVPREARSIQRIPMTRIVGVELRKMFDTRSGFWLMMSVGIAAVLATAATLIFAPRDELSYGSFAGAIGVPMTIILPMIAVLAVTSEWSQRTGLTTFTLVPHRGRVFTAKLVGTLVVGVTSIAIAFAVGALGNVVGSAIAGVDTSWDISLGNAATILLADALGMLMGFMLGVLFRSSAGAIVGYFVYALALPAAFEALSAYQDWFHDHRGWLDFNFASSALYDGGLSGTEWAQVGVSGFFWLVLPLAIGLRLVLRSEVK